MAKVAALWGSSGSVPGPDGFVPGAGEDRVIARCRCRRESERGQGRRGSTIDMGGFTSLDNAWFQHDTRYEQGQR